MTIAELASQCIAAERRFGRGEIDYDAYRAATDAFWSAHEATLSATCDACAAGDCPYHDDELLDIRAVAITTVAMAITTAEGRDA